MSDLISKAEAIDALCNDYCGGHQDCKYYPNCENLRSVQKLPSAQPAEPKRIRGKWIEYEQEFMLEGSLETVQKTVKECSVCTTKIAGMVGIMNFCPNCGADMREVNNESN